MLSCDAVFMAPTPQVAAPTNLDFLPRAYIDGSLLAARRGNAKRTGERDMPRNVRYDGGSETDRTRILEVDWAYLDANAAFDWTALRPIGSDD